MNMTQPESGNCFKHCLSYFFSRFESEYVKFISDTNKMKRHDFSIKNKKFVKINRKTIIYSIN
ncbi:hypothetical protein CFPU101_17410 [Chroococcus sp. FPU101]|nr:hypothetical protein CFPU101_17410 [Chroococcus sp. FPU101]